MTTQIHFPEFWRAMQRRYRDRRELGTRFERVVQWYLRQRRRGASLPLFRDVWLWRELKSGPDDGIDLVAEGEQKRSLWAIQAKTRNRLERRHVDALVCATGEGYAGRVLITTARAVTPRALRTIQDRGVQLFAYGDLAADNQVDWSNALNPPRMIHRGKPPVCPHSRLSRLTLQQVDAAAKLHHEVHGRWPSTKDKQIRINGHTYTGREIDRWLRAGGHGGLTDRIAKQYGHRPWSLVPRLSAETIQKWARAEVSAGNPPPTVSSGKVSACSTERWRNIDAALRRGGRGLPGGSSLSALLEKAGITQPRPRLRVSMIRRWIAAYKQEHHAPPKATSGAIQGARGETWGAINGALRHGRRGLAGGSSLAQLGGVRRPPQLTVDGILCAAKIHQKRHRHWPTRASGTPVPGLRGETWHRIDQALAWRTRGLTGTDYKGLADLLWRRLGVRHHLCAPPLTVKQIVAWAEAHHARTGSWPTRRSGAIRRGRGVPPGETWARIDASLTQRLRGIPKDDEKSSLRQLLVSRGKMAEPPRLTVGMLEGWAREYKRRHRQWPTNKSGPVGEFAPGESWAAIDAAIRGGRRGLVDPRLRVHSLSKLLNRMR